jgi:ubiquinone/menaquinone biosynthesis C-methylase UbiE
MMIDGESTTNRSPSHYLIDATPASDIWSDWLLGRRHGNDPNHAPVMKGMVDRIRDRVLDGAALQPGMLLVDVGAGDGLIAFGAFERIGPNLHAILADVSMPLLRRAEERAIAIGVRDRCTFLHTAAEQLDGVADATADVVIIRAVLAYVADRDTAIRQVLRVLKPGGRVSIAEPVHQDQAIKLAALTARLQANPVGPCDRNALLVQRCLSAQLPSTLPDIQKLPLTNYTERDLVQWFQKGGFADIHLELHIDVRKSPAMPWDTYIDTAPHPGAPTLREIFQANFSDAERSVFEQAIRPDVESGQRIERSTNAYLTAVKPR